VVIAIIALLIGILLPALGKARDSARTVRCLVNMKQLELAHQMYMADHREHFIDAALPHGGIIAQVRNAWLVQLNDYAGGSLLLQSPVDRSPWWDPTRGGTDDGATLEELLAWADENDAVLSDGDFSNDPTPPKVARLTSYGVNDFTAESVAPSGAPDPVTGRKYDRRSFTSLAKIDRPTDVVHFLMMAPENIDQSGTVNGRQPGYAKSDHVHAAEWDLSFLNDTATASAAAAQMWLSAHGGNWNSPAGESNYAMLDGSAHTWSFRKVYRSVQVNRFHPLAALPSD
jgi:type II secretory pathway pseudopilin PulG